MERRPDDVRPGGVRGRGGPSASGRGQRCPELRTSRRVREPGVHCRRPGWTTDRAGPGRRWGGSRPQRPPESARGMRVCGLRPWLVVSGREAGCQGVAGRGEQVERDAPAEAPCQFRDDVRQRRAARRAADRDRPLDALEAVPGEFVDAFRGEQRSSPVQERGVDVICGVERAQAHRVKLQYFRDAALAEAGECRGGVVSSE